MLKNGNVRTEHRTDIDDQSVAGGPHRWQHRANRAVYPDDVGVEQHLGLVRRKGFGHASRRDTGIVDENVDATGLLEDGRDRAIHRTVVGNVELNDIDFLATQRVGVSAVAAGDVAHRGEYTMACSRECFRGVTSEAG